MFQIKEDSVNPSTRIKKNDCRRDANLPAAASSSVLVTDEPAPEMVPSSLPRIFLVADLEHPPPPQSVT